MAHAIHAKTLPADLNAPAFVSAWRTRALTVGAVFGVLGIILALLANGQGDHFQHLLRSWLLGFMITLGFSIGGMALLMVQYLSGGKWGLLIRRWCSPAEMQARHPHRAGIEVRERIGPKIWHTQFTRRHCPPT